MKAETFDEKFDEGQDVSADLDLDRLSRPGPQHHRVDVELPEWMIDSLDREARAPLLTVAFEPFVRGTSADAGGLSRFWHPQALFDDAPHKQLSTIDGQSGIVVVVHSASSVDWLASHLQSSG